jgi:hypothetical protein
VRRRFFSADFVVLTLFFSHRLVGAARNGDALFLVWISSSST